MELDEKDKKIIREIMKSPKITDSELAEKIGLSRSGAAKRRNKLEENNEIQYYAAPNLKEASSKSIAGRFTFPSDISFEETVEMAEKFSKRGEIINCLVRESGQGKWHLSFIALADELESKKETKKKTQEWMQEIRELSGKEKIGISMSDLVTHFVKMLGQEI
ncbi:MAG: winged helix-turn-helix transcriptional regulator [archaeon]